MHLRIDASGLMSCLYGEGIDLTVLGRVSIRRATQVEPDDTGRWWADLSPVRGPRLGPYLLRSEALQAEVGWIERNLLGSEAGDTPIANESAGPEPS